MRPEETLDYHIKSSWLSISKMYNQIAAKYDMTQAVGFTLLMLDEKLGTFSTKIGPQLGMEATSMTRLLKSMEKDGLIVKESDEHDKRKVRICLTEKGREKRKVAKSVVKKFNKKILEELSEQEFETFKGVINKVQMIVDEYKS